MSAKKKKPNTNVKCDICGYENKKEFLQYSGVCHLCGKILDDRAYFKAQMNKRLRLWRGKKWGQWS